MNNTNHTLAKPVNQTDIPGFVTYHLPIAYDVEDRVEDTITLVVHSDIEQTMIKKIVGSIQDQAKIDEGFEFDYLKYMPLDMYRFDNLFPKVRNLYEKDMREGNLTIRSKSGKLIFKTVMPTKVKGLRSFADFISESLKAYIADKRSKRDYIENSRIVLENAVLDGLETSVTYFNLKLIRCSLRESVLRLFKAHFEKCDLTRSKLVRVDNSYFEGCNLQSCNLDTVAETNYVRCSFFNSSMPEIVSHTHFSKCFMLGAHELNRVASVEFTKCILAHSNFKNAYFFDVSLKECNVNYSFLANIKKSYFLTLGYSTFKGCAISFANDEWPENKHINALFDEQLRVIGRATRSDGHEYIAFVGPMGGVVIKAGCRTWTNQRKDNSPKHKTIVNPLVAYPDVFCGRECEPTTEIKTINPVIFNAPKNQSSAFSKGIKHTKDETDADLQEEALAIIRFLTSAYEIFMKEQNARWAFKNKG